MKGFNLSPTAQEILTLYFAHPGQKFYVNELIRKTGRYPNSIQQALKSLEKQKILLSSQSGRLRFYRLVQSYKFLTEAKRIVAKGVSQEALAGEEGYNWVKILNRQTSYSFTAALCVANTEHLKKIYGFSVPNFWHNSITLGVYYLKEELVFLGKAVSEKIETDLNFAKKDIRQCRAVCDRLTKIARDILLQDLPKGNNQSLARLLKKFYLHYLAVFPFVTVPHGIERYFEAQIRTAVQEKEALGILLSPVSIADQERDNALNIAAHAKRQGFDRKFNQLLDDHWERFCWFPLWSIHAKPLTRDYFEEEIKNILAKVEDPKKELKRLKAEEEKGRKKLERILKETKASPALKQRVHLLQEYIVLRMYRKNAICQAHYYHLPLLYEIGRRLGLTSEEVKLLSYEELLNGLLKRISLKELKSLAGERQKGWAILMWKGKIKTITGVKNIIETMERYQIVAPGPMVGKVVKGRSACRGRVTGRVKVVRKLSELDKVEEGDILVAKMTTPDYMVAIHKTAAIVTDEGGVTCHAAIVSREFNTPCVIGTRNATQILSDNDLVKVDADEGVVRVVEAVDIDEDVKQIYGKTAYKGKVRGRIRVVLDASDFPKVQGGDILVAPQTTPEYLSSLYKVKGFIVDEESITSHAMLYAKALRLPALIGTQFARHVFQDGERVELDATEGFVKRLDS